MRPLSFAMRPLLVLCAALFLAPAAACTRYIPNTTVPDTEENREVIDTMERYRHAVEARDVGALLALTHAQYLDDVGTPTGDDDLDYGSLGGRLNAWSGRVSEVRFEIRYHRISVDGSRIYVEYRYTASFKMQDSEGDLRWNRRVADARAVLTRDDGSGELRFLSGL